MQIARAAAPGGGTLLKCLPSHVFKLVSYNVTYREL